MTGQLFVVPAGRPEDPYVRLSSSWPTAASSASATSASSGKIGLYGRDPADAASSSPRSAAAAVFAAFGPEPLDPAFTLRDFRAPDPATVAAGSSRSCSTSRSSPASATSTPTRRCGRRGSIRCGPAGTLRPADERRLYERVRTDPGRGGRAARQLDRRLHGARRRRLDAGAPAGLPADRRAVPALRPADQADRHRRAFDALLLVVPAAAGRPTARARRAILRTMTGGPRRAGRRWTELAGEGTVGLTPARPTGARRGHGPSGRSGPPRPAGRRRALGAGRARRSADVASCA